MPAGTDRLTIEYDIGRILQQYDPALAALPTPVVTTLSAADTATIISTQLGRGTRDANAYDGRLVKVVTQGATGPAAGAIAGVVDASYLTNDRVTILPAFPTGVTDGKLLTGQSVIFYPLLGSGPLPPETVLQKLNEVLRLTDTPQIGFPSLVGDADFQAADHGATLTSAAFSAWNLVGAPTSNIIYGNIQGVVNASQGPLGFLNRRMVYVVSGATARGIESSSIPVSPGEIIKVCCWVYADAASLDVVLRNQTAGSDITTVTSTVRQGLMQVMFDATVPAACNEVRIRFVSNGTASFGVVAPVVLQSTTRRLYNAPYACQRELQILDCFTQRTSQPHGSTTANQFSAFSGQREPFADYQTYRNDVTMPGSLITASQPVVRAINMNPLQIAFAATANGPVGMEFYGANKEVQLTDPAYDALMMDRDFITMATVTKILKERGLGTYKGWSEDAALRARAMGYGTRQLVINALPDAVTNQQSG